MKEKASEPIRELTEELEKEIMNLWKNNAIFHIAVKLNTTIPIVMKCLSKHGYGIPKKHNSNYNID